MFLKERTSMNGETSFEEAFERIAPRLSDLVGPIDDPAQLVRNIHRQWKELGGTFKGKIRHSDRFLEEQLRAQGTLVRSLTPKLVGKTHFSPRDGSDLVRYLLSHWPTSAESGAIKYTYIFPSEDIDVVSERIRELLSERASQRVASTASRTGADPSETLPGQNAATEIVDRFKECHALITVSPEHIFVAAGPGKELVGFRDLMDLLLKVEMDDFQQRVLIWVLDLGTPHLDDESTRKKYFNVQQLIVRLKAIKHYQDARSEKRLSWLRSNAAVVTLDTYGEWRSTTRLSRLPDFSTHHATLSNPNPDWLKDAHFRALYGSELERVQERVMTVFFNGEGKWESSPELETDLRYFGFSTFKKPTGGYEARALELPALPLRYAEAFRAIYAAVIHTLKLEVPSLRMTAAGGETAVKQLAYLGFRVQGIDDFVTSY
jgi:hypothetical protein